MPAIMKSRNGRLKAVACRSRDHAESIAQEHDIPSACGRYEEILEDPQVDAVYIPLPNHLHREWTLRALEAGKHVLCEKPLAMNAREAESMVQASRERGLLLMEALMYRFHPRSRQVKALIDEGAIGDPRLVRAAFCFSHPDPSDIRFRPEMGGGALLDVGCYGVSLARWLFGAEPERVQAVAEYGPTGIDLTLIGLLEFPGKRFAIVEASFATALQQTFGIVGTQGAIELPHNAFIPWEEEASFRLRGVDEKEGKVVAVPGADEYQLMVEHFAEAVLNRAELEFQAEESIGNMRVLDALARAAREGRSVPIPPDSGRA